MCDSEQVTSFSEPCSSYLENKNDLQNGCEEK